MLKGDVKIGSTYLMAHSSGRIEVRILREVVRQMYGRSNRRMTHWEALNLKTKKLIKIKSAAKLLREIKPPAVPPLPVPTPPVGWDAIEAGLEVEPVAETPEARVNAT